MVDDAKYGNDWYHPLYRSKSRDVADKRAESYRQQGYKARVKPMQDFDNWGRSQKKSEFYHVFVSENPAQRAAPKKKKSKSSSTSWWDGPIPF